MRLAYVLLAHALVALLCAAPRVADPPPPHRVAYATLLYSEDFVNATRYLSMDATLCNRCRVLFYSLRRLNAHLHADFLVLAAQGWREPPLSAGSRASLAALGCIVKDVATIPSPWMTVPSPAMWAQFTKLRLWEQMQYEKIVYLDSDIIVVADISALFDILHSPLAAARDINQMGQFSQFELNGGVLVLRPNASLVPTMLADAKHMPQAFSLEQSFLSGYFDWQTLPPIYNMPATMFLRAPSLFKSARVVHYTHAKPWTSNHPLYEVWFRDIYDLWYRCYEDMLRGYSFTPS